MFKLQAAVNDGKRPKNCLLSEQDVKRIQVILWWVFFFLAKIIEESGKFGKSNLLKSLILSRTNGFWAPYNKTFSLYHLKIKFTKYIFDEKHS